jgi:hypothetical protein
VTAEALYYDAVGVAWAAAGDGGSPITGYEVVADPGGATCVAPATGRGCLVSGLTTGTTYTFTVTAINDLGASDPSEPSGPVTPVASTPGPPRQLSAIGGHGRADVSWWAPSRDGGSPITHYTVTSSPTTTTCTTPTPTTCRFADLDANTTYRFTVTATNAIGTSQSTTTVGPSQLTIAAVPRTVTWPRSTVLSGRLSASSGTTVAGQVVKIFAKPAGATRYLEWASTTTGANGSWTTSIAPQANTSYVARFNGGPGVLGRASSSAGVSVAPHALMYLNDWSASRHQTVTFSGSVAPAPAGSVVQLQRRIRGAWQTVATTRSASKQTYSFGWKPPSYADYAFRVHFPAQRGFAAATSRTLTLYVN